MFDDERKKKISIIIAIIVLLILIIGALIFKRKPKEEVIETQAVAEETFETDVDIEETNETFENIEETSEGFDINQYLNKDNESKAPDILSGITDNTENKENSIFDINNTEESNEIITETDNYSEEELKYERDKILNDNSYVNENEERIKSFKEANKSYGNIEVDTADDGRIVDQMDSDFVYDLHDVGVDRERGTFDISAGIDKSSIKVGSDADAVIVTYNSLNRLKFPIECSDSLENVVIPFRIEYKEPLASADAKIEPRFAICEGLMETLNVDGRDYIPKVSVVYLNKTNTFREGYILTKLPIGRYNRCSLKFEGYDEDASYVAELN